MAFSVTAANTLIEIPLQPQGVLTYFHLTCSALNTDTQLTTAQMVAGIVAAGLGISSMDGATLVDAYDAGGAGAGASLTISGGGTGLIPNVTPGGVGTGFIDFRSCVDGAPAAAVDAITGWEVVVGLRQ